MVKKLIFSFFVICFLVFALLIVLPAPIDSVAYSPPIPKKLTGALTPNRLLQDAQLLALGKIQGPEEVAVDNQGRVYAGTPDGKILVLAKDGNLDVFADNLGRPLGMTFDSRQNLIVADAYLGLLAIDPQGKVEVLTDSADNIPFKFTDALDIASDGKIYFSDASDRFSQSEYLYDLLEAKPHGRLLQYDPKTGRTKQLLDGLYFANGVALSKQQDFVLVNETYRYRIIRYWLKGPKAGSHEIFIENLPGFPDNISSNGKGKFWLALFTVRNADVDGMHPHPFLKNLLSKLPKALWPQPVPYGFVVALNEAGQITQSLQDPGGEHLKEITSVKEHQGFLYLGSLHNDRIGKYKLTRTLDKQRL